MRIIGGRFKSKRIQAPKSIKARPTTDFAKESLFNILNNRYDFTESSVLDLFAGIGSISYEFYSRGVEDLTTVDIAHQSVKFIEHTLHNLGLERPHVLKMDAFKYLEKANRKYDIIFADPPYDLEGIVNIPHLVFGNNLLAEDGILVVEHGDNTNLQDAPNYVETKKYGKVHFSIFEY